MSVALSSATAAEYDLTDLGAAPVSYIEHKFDINDSGRIAYTAIVSGKLHATYSQAGASPVDLHVLHLDQENEEISRQSRAQAINNANVIVGYRFDVAEIFRTAMLWRDTGSGYDTSEALHDSLTGSPEISSAYGISDATVGAGAAYVVGYQRATSKSGSDAVMWTIDGSGNVLSAGTVPRTSGMDYSIAYAVNDDGYVVGGEGNFGTTAMYAFIYDSVSDTVAPIPGVQASDGYSTSVAAGISENFVTGYALDTATSEVTAFVHEIGTTNTETGIKVGPNAGATGPRSLGYSVRESGGSPVVMGLSEVNGSTGSMGGLVYDREGSNPQECDVNFSGDWPGRVTHVFAMNANGQGIGLRSNGGTQAVFIEDVTPEPLSTAFFQRDLESAGATDYYWGRVTGGSTGSAAIMLSNSPGCGGAFSCDASVDLSDEGTSGTDFFVTGSNNFAGGTAFTDQFTVDPTSFAYAQAFSNSCDFSSVGSTPSIPTANVNPAGTDPWGDDWADCTGWINAETNISDSSIYCGGCAPSNNTDDGRVCTNDMCNNGSIVNTYDTQSNYCFISSNCIPQATDANDAAATNPSNECQACYTAQNRYSYTNDPNGSSCTDDGLSCTSDVCQGGSCNHPLDANRCLIGGTCYTEDQANPGNECEACQSGTATASFTDDPNGTSCTNTDPYACTVPQCQGGNCDQRAAFSGCQIGSACYAFNQERPGNECQACQSSNPENWTNDSNGTGCDTDSCYASQSCTSGSCGGGNPVVDSYENDDTWQTRTHLGSWNEDHFWTGGGKSYRGENKTIFPENDDDWYSFYADDYACDRGRYSACGTENYDCNCDWLGCDTCTRNRICNINCGFGGSANKNHETEGGANGGPQGRADLIVPSGSNYNACVYLQCNVGGQTPSGINWFGNGSATGNVTINGASLKGRCGLNGGSTNENIEFHPDCPGANDSVLAFVRVYDVTNNARCNSTYQIRVGNDKD